MKNIPTEVRLEKKEKRYILEFFCFVIIISSFLFVLWAGKVLPEVDGLCRTAIFIITLGGPMLTKKLMPLSPYCRRGEKLVEPVLFESLSEIQQKILKYKVDQYRKNQRLHWGITIILLIPIVLSYMITPAPFIKKELGYADIDSKIAIVNVTINSLMNFVGIAGISLFYGIIVAIGFFESWSLWQIIKNWNEIIQKGTLISQEEFTHIFQRRKNKK